MKPFWPDAAFWGIIALLFGIIALDELILSIPLLIGGCIGFGRALFQIYLGIRDDMQARNQLPTPQQHLTKRILKSMSITTSHLEANRQGQYTNSQLNLVQSFAAYPNIPTASISSIQSTEGSIRFFLKKPRNTKYYYIKINGVIFGPYSEEFLDNFKRQASYRLYFAVVKFPFLYSSLDQTILLSGEALNDA